MSNRVKHITVELPVTKTLQKQIISDKRRAFKSGEKLSISYVKYG